MNGPRVIVGASFARQGASAGHDLARAARALDPTALGAVAVILASGLVRDAPEVAAARDVVLVPMAGHLADTPSGPARQLASALAVRHPGWTIAPALARVADAPAAGAQRSGDTPAAMAMTLRWAPVPGTGPVLVVDDVVHTGDSLEAAWLAAPPELRARLFALVAFRAIG